MWRVWPIIILCLCSCSRESELVSRGPSGFCTEDMGVSLQSIPHQKVDYFNGKVLVLALSPTDYQAVLADSRFQWQKPPDISETSSMLGEWQFIDHDRYDVVYCQTSQRAGTSAASWRLFGLDKTRRKFVMCEDHWEFFKRNSP